MDLLLQLGKKFKRGPSVEELPEYARATHFLGTLGMQNYQKNLKRGLLNDSTVHLWNDRYGPVLATFPGSPCCRDA